MMLDLLRHLHGNGIEVRLPHLPSAPELPLRAESVQAEYVSHRTRVGKDTWTTIQQEADSRGVSPGAVLMTACADVLTLWSKQPRFTLDLVLPDQEATRPLTSTRCPATPSRPV
jgi:pyochelin synthetase